MNRTMRLTSADALWAQAKPSAVRPGSPKVGAAAEAVEPKPTAVKEKSDPELDKALDEWHKSSKLIKKLEGEILELLKEVTA